MIDHNLSRWRRHGAFTLMLITTVLSLAASHAGAAGNSIGDSQHAFVRVTDGRLSLRQQAYCFVGTNLWYGAYLGSAAAYGDRDRLRRELDTMKAAGISNVRVLGASEDSPLKHSLANTFRNESADYNELLLEGLDYLLSELARREMTAVIYLNNFWEWSGGMATYLYWVNAGEIVDPSDPAQPWPAFADFSAAFYSSDEANRLFRHYVTQLVTRTNTVNGVRYPDDPTIMAWQLANEPRPGYRNELGFARLDGYYAWIGDTARMIKTLDSNHLVSLGSEGTVGCLQSEECYLRAHAIKDIDYLTFHMWPKNWNWIDADDMRGTFDRTLRLAAEYMNTHLRFARELGKPIVLEEFGLERDGGALSLDSPTSFRDRFFTMIFERVESDALAGGPFNGTNFWTWGGSGRAEHEDFRWRPDDRAFTGDPPQEAQGLNSVFDTDGATLETFRRHSANLVKMNCGPNPGATTQ